MSYLLICAVLLGWALGMYHAHSICANQANDLAAALNDKTSGYWSEGSDLILRNQLASAAGCAWRIKLWLQPWKWGRIGWAEARKGKP
jgi:hypothetical protein